jgi:pilus assembly protein Flp/PilA
MRLESSLYPTFPGFAPFVLIWRTVMKSFVNFLAQEEGASGAEYALLLAIVGAAIAAAALGLGGAISAAINNAAALINP